MGLAPYGEPPSSTSCSEIVRLDDGSFALDLELLPPCHGEGVDYQWEDGSRQAAGCSRRAGELLGPRARPTEPLEDQHRDIARSVQAIYEERSSTC